MPKIHLAIVGVATKAIKLLHRGKTRVEFARLSLKLYKFFQIKPIMVIMGSKDAQELN